MSILEQMFKGNSLSEVDARLFVQSICNQSINSETLGAILAVMSYRGETAIEIKGMVDGINSQKGPPFAFDHELLDVCGTGGDGSGTFNISTTAALLVAACGVRVAKHGNRSVSSSSGSADLMFALGYKEKPTNQELSHLLREFGFAFFFAPDFHESFKAVAPLRAKLKVKTVFNLLGPLVNPMRPQTQLVGVYNQKFIPIVIEALRRLGKRRAIVVSSQSGLDEFSICDQSSYALLQDGKITYHELNPQDLGLRVANLEELRGGNPTENAAISRKVLLGEGGPQADVVNLNAAAGLLAAGAVKTIREGLDRASEQQRKGAGFKRMSDLISYLKGGPDA